jgi:peroxiredoxin
VLSEGAAAPGFELPALVDGAKRRVDLDEYLGDDVVILAFYPADFNPACDDESCDLDELDLFTMQKDVTILGISPDSVYSHRAFAERYDLRVPLLADTDGEVADRYDIGLVDDIGQHLLERAVAVVDHDGTIQYSWSTDDMTELPRVEEIKDALAETGGDDTAFARYRVGHAHYTEGRRSFTSAMHSFRDTEWMMAQHDFQQAREEFEEAADQFDTAVRFVDDASLAPIYEGANEKATALWQAADWLVRSASAYSSGSGTEGQELRDDAERPLETVREYAEPPDPDGEWPPEIATLEKDEPEDTSILPTETDVDDAALTVDIDAEVDDTDGEPGATADEPAEVAAELDGPDDEVTAGAEATVDEPAVEGDESPVDDDIDDEELAEIQAELAANNPESEPTAEEVTEESTAIVDAPPMGEPDSADETADDGAGEIGADATDERADDGVGETADDMADETLVGASAGTADETAVQSGDDETVQPESDDTVEESDADDAVDQSEHGGNDTEEAGQDSEPVAPSAFELAEPDPDPLGPEDYGVDAGGHPAPAPRVDDPDHSETEDSRADSTDDPDAPVEESTGAPEDDGTHELRDPEGEPASDE